MTEKELQQLRSLVPLHMLSDERFGELTEDLRVEFAARGTSLFREGDTAQQNVYLLEGQVGLMNGATTVEQIAAGSDTARFPIAHELPRRFTAQVTRDSRFVRIDGRRLSEFLAREDKVDYQVNDLDENEAGDDWMTQLLHSRVMQQIPAANIQQVMMRVELVTASAGEAVIRQGEPGDYFYMLNRGKAVVSRDPGDGRPPVELARLGPGSAFGEEALLSDSPRNSSITMLTDGVLLRLSKADFVELIHHPLSNACDFETARGLVADGAVWLDLRRPEKFEQEHLPDSVNVPFASLRHQLSSLAPDRHYILVSDDGSKLASAAFLLTEKGFEASVLNGGYASVTTEPVQAERGPDSDAAAATGATSAEDGGTEPVNADEVASLRERVKQLEAQRVAAETERQASLHQLRDAIDKARRRMEAVEEDRQAIGAERDQLREDLERLGERVEQVEQARQDLQAQLESIEDNEAQWKERLRKAEAQGIAERDRAESATQQLEELAGQLESARRDRELAREANEQSTGELKEALTEIRLEYEQLQADYEALQAAAGGEGATADEGALREALQAAERARDAARAETQQALAELEQWRTAARDQDAEQRRADEAGQRLAEAEARNEALEGELAAARDQAEQAKADAAELERVIAERDEAVRERDSLERQVAERESENAAGREALEQQLAEARSLAGTAEADAEERFAEILSLQERMAELEQELGRRAAEVDDTEARAADAQREAAERLQALEGEVDRLQSLSGELENARDGLQVELEQAQSLAGQLEAVRAELARRDDAEAGLRAELEAARGEVEHARAAAASESEGEAERREALQADLADVTAERDAAREEVRELRLVMEQYVEQIRTAQDGPGDADDALASELDMVREQAARDLTHLRGELDKARERVRELEQAAGHDPLNAEALRQEVASLRDSLAERQRELAEAERNRQRVEDQLEDAAREIERLRQDNVIALSQLNSEQEVLSATSAGRHLHADKDPADEIEEIVNGGLRDQRVKPPRGKVSAEHAGGGRSASVMVGLLIGLVLVIGGLELAMMLTGRGELFSLLFGPGG